MSLLSTEYNSYGMPENIEDFYYSFNRLQSHMSISEWSFDTTFAVLDSNPDMLSELGYSSDESGWDAFTFDLRGSQKEILYEQGIISLLAIFEGFINDTLKFIFYKDTKLQSKLKVNIEYGELSSKYNKLLEIIIDDNLNKLSNWPQKIKIFSKAPISINLESKKETKIIKEAIAYRNALIHNKGEIDSRVVTANPNYANLVDTSIRIPIDRTFYKKTSKAVENLVLFIDNRIKEKYT